MFTTIDEFLDIWRAQVDITFTVLLGLTDESLSQAVKPGAYTLLDLARWIGYSTERVPWDDWRTMEPQKIRQLDNVAALISFFRTNAEEFARRVRTECSDQQLWDVLHGPGPLRPTKARALVGVIFHQIKLRAQIMVLMRQAGLHVPYEDPEIFHGCS